MINRKNKIYYYDLGFRKLKFVEQQGTHIDDNISKNKLRSLSSFYRNILSKVGHFASPFPFTFFFLLVFPSALTLGT